MKAISNYIFSYMNLISKLPFYVVLAALIAPLVFIYVFFYLPAVNSYRNIGRNLVSVISDISAMQAVYEGRPSLPEQKKETEFYYGKLNYYDENFLKDQTELDETITKARPYLDTTAEAKLKEFVKWTQAQQYSILKSDSSLTLKPTLRELEEWQKSLMALLPFSFREYLIFYLRNGLKNQDKY